MQLIQGGDEKIVLEEPLCGVGSEVFVSTCIVGFLFPKRTNIYSPKPAVEWVFVLRYLDTYFGPE